MKHLDRDRRLDHRPIALRVWCIAVCAATLSTTIHAADTDPRYRAGLGLLNRSMHAEAAVELQAFLDASKSDSASAPFDPAELATARYSLALCHATLGRPADAVKELARLQAPQGFAFAADALFLHGQCAAGAGDHVAAASVLEALNRDHPSFPRLDRAVALQGESLLRAGRQAQAIVVLREVPKRWPESPSRNRAALLCASAEAATGDDATAAERLAALREREPTGAFAAQATVLEAQCRRRLGQFEPALSLYQAALVGDAKTGATAGIPTDAVRAELFLGQAACLRALGRHDACVRACESSIAGLARTGTGGATTLSVDDGRLLSATRLMMLHARFDLGQALVQQGRGDEGRAALEALVAATDEAHDGHRVHDVTEADRAIDAHERIELRVAALRSLAALAANEQRLGDAAALLGRLATMKEIQPADRASALADHAAMLAAAGSDHQAAEAFDRFLAAHHDDPRRREVSVRRAIIAARQGRHESAIASFDEALRKDGGPADGPPLDATLRASATFEHATSLSAVGRPEDAADRLRTLLEPTTPAALRGRAAVELARLAVNRGELDDHRQALDLLEQVAAARNAAPAGALDDVREPELFLRGTSQLKLGDAAAAAGTLEAFARECPESPLRFPAMLLRADALLASDRPVDAITVLEAIVGADPDCALAAPALLRLGDACATAEQWGRSQQAFERFLTLSPDCDRAKPLWHHARFGVGQALERQGKLAEALEAYRDVAGRHRGPTAARAQFQVGECLYAAGKHDDAVRELLKVDVLFAEPQWSAAALCEAGRCLMELGRGADAKAQFDAVVERFPESSWATVAPQRRAEIRPAALPGRETSSRLPSPSS